MVSEFTNQKSIIPTKQNKTKQWRRGKIYISEMKDKLDCPGPEGETAKAPDPHDMKFKEVNRRHQPGTTVLSLQ